MDNANYTLQDMFIKGYVITIMHIYENSVLFYYAFCLVKFAQYQ